MNFTQSDEQKMVVESAARFGASLRARLRETEKSGVSPDLVRQYEGLGFLGLAWPEKLGGSHMGWLTKMMALEEIAWGDAAAGLALDRVSWICASALDLGEPAERILARASKQGDGFVPSTYVDLDERLNLGQETVSGVIPYLPANRCDALFLIQGDRLVLLATGVKLEPTVPGALDALGSSRAEIQGRAEWVMNLQPAASLKLVGLWRLHVAAMLLGLSRAAYEYARQYCLDRIAFGKKVAHHQAVAFTLSDMAIAVEGARLLVHEAALNVDRGADSTFELHSAYLQAAECALFVSNYAVQFLASAGYVRDHPVEKWMREARALTLLLGGIDGAQADADRALALQIQAA
ncbi:MAG: acyl-CoA dehydrogenase family protein [Nitrospirae bacterium]|nr:acyl-CoA dehydrogenase family protein [Nitrospirota bacterium]